MKKILTQETQGKASSMKNFLNVLVSFIIAMLLMIQSVYADIYNSMALAYINNPALEAERKNVQAIQEDMSQAFAGFMPSASFSMSRGMEDIETGFANRDFITDTKTWELTQPLFNGGQTIMEMKQAKAASHAAQENLRSLEQRVLLAAAKNYIAIARDKEIVKFSQDNAQSVKDYHDAAQERFRFGEGTQTNIWQAEARMARARADLNKAIRNLETSKANYFKVVQADAPKDVKLPKKVASFNVSFSQVIAEAMENNPDILAAMGNFEASKHSVSVQKTQLLPDASVSVTNTTQKGFFVSDNTDSLQNNSVMFNLTVPLYQSGAEYSRIRQAKRLSEKADFDIRETQQKVKEDIGRFYHSLAMARKSLKLYRDLVLSAQKSVDAVKEEVSLGSRTTLDLLDAEQELFEAKTSFIKAKEEELISTLELMALMGHMNPQRLELDVKTYDVAGYGDSVKFKPIGF